jgi:uncharacterized membrane protein
VAALTLTALLFLCLAWELWLAPLRPGGSLAALKALPLLAPLFGVLHGRRYTYQWSSMLILFYFTEGVVRGYAESGMGAWLAWAEIALSSIYFGLALTYARLSRPSLQAKPAD